MGDKRLLTLEDPSTDVFVGFQYRYMVADRHMQKATFTTLSLLQVDSEDHLDEDAAERTVSTPKKTSLLWRDSLPPNELKVVHRQPCLDGDFALRQDLAPMYSLTFGTTLEELRDVAGLTVATDEHSCTYTFEVHFHSKESRKVGPPIFDAYRTRHFKIDGPGGEVIIGLDTPSNSWSFRVGFA